MSTLYVQLDQRTLEALFPEGSEARASLTRSATAELIRRLAVKEVKHLSDELRKESREVAVDALKEMGAMENYFGKIVMTDKLKESVRDMIQGEVNDSARAAARQAAKESLPFVQSLVREQVNNLATAEWRDQLRQMVCTIMRERMTLS